MRTLRKARIARCKRKSKNTNQYKAKGHDGPAWKMERGTKIAEARRPIRWSRKQEGSVGVGISTNRAKKGFAGEGFRGFDQIPCSHEAIFALTKAFNCFSSTGLKALAGVIGRERPSGRRYDDGCTKIGAS